MLSLHGVWSAMGGGGGGVDIRDGAMFEDIARIYLTRKFWAYPLVKTILDGTTFYS